MVRPLEAHVEVAKRLLAQERGSCGDAEVRAAAAARVYETLFRALAPVVGAAGVRALFARSLRLASTEFPGLGGIPMIAEPPEDSVQVAAFLGLMTKFIGDRLVLQIVKTACPAIGEADTGPKEME